MSFQKVTTIETALKSSDLRNLERNSHIPTRPSYDLHPTTSLAPIRPSTSTPLPLPLILFLILILFPFLFFSHLRTRTNVLLRALARSRLLSRARHQRPRLFRRHETRAAPRHALGLERHRAQVGLGRRERARYRRLVLVGWIFNILIPGPSEAGELG